MYQIYPRSYQDSNGDGIGDLQGIISRLDYIASLGVDVIWLGPIYQSPLDDNGYDISDYYQIHPDYGTMADFDELLEGLHARGIKLIMDLVVNHTSDQHQWFQESKKSVDSPYRDYYIWRKPKNDSHPNNWMAWFGGEAWDLDEQTGEYYLHYFLSSQPDLNWENETVRKEVYKNMNWWLDKGIDGFRMDVISLLSKQLDFPDAASTNIHYLAEHHYANGPKIHTYLQEMYREVLAGRDIMTVGEGPGITKELALDYIGDDRKELNMIFQLDAMIIDHGPDGKMDVVPFALTDLKKIMNGWDAAVSERGRNNIFLDNHDFPRMVSRFGNDTTYRVAATNLLNTYLLTMRGTPCIYQGSEIGMTNVAFTNPDDFRDEESTRYIAENGWNEKTQKALHTQSRDNVRTPMQWSAEPAAGFSTANPWINVNPNYTEINITAAELDPNSTLHYFRKLIALRKSTPVLRSGDYLDLLPEHEQLYLYRRSTPNQDCLVILNFSDLEVDMTIQTSGYKLQLCNYAKAADKLRPWESRIYLS